MAARTGTTEKHILCCGHLCCCTVGIQLLAEPYTQYALLRVYKIGCLRAQNALRLVLPITALQLVPVDNIRVVVVAVGDIDW